MRDNIIHHQMHTLDSPSVITFSTERPRMLASWYFIAQNAPTESCRCTTRIPWYHQNPAYTHRILFALTACIFIGRTVPLLKPPQSPHCYLGEVDHAKKNFPHPWPHGKPGLIVLIGPLRPYCSQSPLILLRCVMEIKFAQNLRWLGNWH